MTGCRRARLTWSSATAWSAPASGHAFPLLLLASSSSTLIRFSRPLRRLTRCMCLGVLGRAQINYLPTLGDQLAAVRHMVRIAKPGAQLFIGGCPLLLLLWVFEAVVVRSGCVEVRRGCLRAVVAQASWVSSPALSSLHPCSVSWLPAARGRNCSTCLTDGLLRFPLACVLLRCCLQLACICDSDQRCASFPCALPVPTPIQA